MRQDARARHGIERDDPARGGADRAAPHAAADGLEQPLSTSEFAGRGLDEHERYPQLTGSACADPRGRRERVVRDDRVGLEARDAHDVLGHLPAFDLRVAA